MPICLLDKNRILFPPTELALVEPNGLLAVGGDLEPERIIAAYRQGIFPWYNPGEEILWWSPDPRAVLYLDDFYLSRSLAKIIKQQRFRVTLNRAFPEVMKHCAFTPRADQAGTWINNDMLDAYHILHQQGHAHSIEVWQDEHLVGGLYGLFVNGIFCGESMFHHKANASKVATFYLVQRLIECQAKLIDCQIMNPHLQSLGAKNISRKAFMQLIAKPYTPNNKVEWLAMDLE